MCNCDCELGKFERWHQVRVQYRNELAEDFRKTAEKTPELMGHSTIAAAIAGTFMACAQFVDPERCTDVCGEQHTYEKGCALYV